MKISREIRKKSQKQEKRTAKEFNGYLQPASGALPGNKGDVRTGSKGEGLNEADFLIENKFTDKEYFILKKSIWDKISKEALRDSFRTPLLQIDIQDLSVVVIPKEYYDILVLPKIYPFNVDIVMENNSIRITRHTLEKLIKEAGSKREELVIHISHIGFRAVLLEKDLFLNILRG